MRVLVWVALLARLSYPDSPDTSTTDSTRFPEKRRAREPWEYVVSAPGWLVGAPFILTTRLITASYRFVDRLETLERILSYLFVVRDTTVVVMPAYDDETGAGISFRKLGLFSAGSELELSGTYGTRNRHGVEIEFQDYRPFAPALFLDIGVDYEYIPDRSFFGIGPDNSLDDETNFGRASIASVLLGKVAPGRFVQTSLGATFDKYFIFRGQDDDEPVTRDVFTEEQLPGLDGGGLFLGPAAGIVFDLRGNPWRPGSGVMVNLNGALTWEITGESLSHWITGADIRLYLEAPWFRDRVLVLRSAYESVHGLGDGNVPFFLLRKFDGEGTVRGYTAGRFRDNEMLLLSAEYRYLVWEKVRAKLDAVAFVDAGQVQEDMFSDADLDDFHVAAGGGFRIYNDEMFLGSFLLAFGEDEFSIEAVLGW
jgi:hypothetical protein